MDKRQSCLFFVVLRHINTIVWKSVLLSIHFDRFLLKIIAPLRPPTHFTKTERKAMGGPSAAAYAASAPVSDKHQRANAAVHSLRKTMQHGGAASNNSGNDGADESDGFLSDGSMMDDHEDVDGRHDTEDDELAALYEEEVRAAAMARERDEMKKHFNFPLDRRQGLTSRLTSAMRKKRRLLLRNENLRFRELYKPPEPMVLLIAASLVTIVTLILTKSWPFY